MRVVDISELQELSLLALLSSELLLAMDRRQAGPMSEAEVYSAASAAERLREWAGVAAIVAKGEQSPPQGPIYLSAAQVHAVIEEMPKGQAPAQEEQRETARRHVESLLDECIEFFEEAPVEQPRLSEAREFLRRLCDSAVARHRRVVLAEGASTGDPARQEQHPSAP
jgi:hypothetical protein